jgi:hypothetical protein
MPGGEFKNFPRLPLRRGAFRPNSSTPVTVWEHICVACHACHKCKGAEGETQDPLTGRARLFHPRLQVWREHFCWSEEDETIVGLTPVGRATVEALHMHHPAIVEARHRWARVGWHPSPGER